MNSDLIEAIEVLEAAAKERLVTDSTNAALFASLAVLLSEVGTVNDNLRRLMDAMDVPADT